MKKIKSVEHAFEVLGQEVELKNFYLLDIPKQDLQPLIDHYLITKIIEANNKLNKNWKANWGDTRQTKYSVYQRVKIDSSKPAGFGFSYAICAYWSTHTTVGSRLVVGSSAEALYIGTDFIHLFESAWLIIEPKE